MSRRKHRECYNAGIAEKAKGKIIKVKIGKLDFIQKMKRHSLRK